VALWAADCAEHMPAIFETEAPDDTRPGEKIDWQMAHLPADARIALRRLPPLGENPAGPLGVGLLSRGVLAVAIRDLQSRLAARD
jgi:hypothetical protein